MLRRVGTVNLSNPRAICAGSPPRFTRSRVTYEAYAVSRTSTRPQVDSAVSAEMSLRYGRLFDSTVRTEYERALTAAKAHLGTLPTEPPHGRTPLPLVDGDWKQAPAIN